MKTFKYFVVLIAFALFALLGCSEKSLSPVAPIDKAVTQTLDKKGPVVHSAQGSTNGTYYGLFDKNIVNTVTAHEYSDGTYGGHYFFNLRNALHDKSIWWNGDVLFLKVYTNVPGHGNFAVIGGADGGIYEGYYSIWFVIDNGSENDAETSYEVASADNLNDAIIEWSKDPITLINELGVVPCDRGNLRVN